MRDARVSSSPTIDSEFPVSELCESMRHPQSNYRRYLVAVIVSSVFAIVCGAAFLAQPVGPIRVAVSSEGPAEADTVTVTHGQDKAVEGLRIGRPIPVEERALIRTAPNSSTHLTQTQTRSDRVSMATEIARRDISRLPEVALKMRTSNELDHLVVDSVSYSARRDPARTLAATAKLGVDERNHARALVGHELARGGDLYSAMSVMKSLAPDNSRTMLLWTIAEKYADRDFSGATQWLRASFPKGSNEREEALGVIVDARIGSNRAGELQDLLPDIENKTDRINAITAVARSMAAELKTDAFQRFTAGLADEESQLARDAYQKTIRRLSPVCVW